MGDTLKTACRELRAQGRSLNEICSILGRGKSTVYPHIQDIPLSEERRLQIQRENAERMRQYALANNGITRNTKGVSLLGKHPLPFPEWNAGLVGLVAHLIFDGTINAHSCVYYNRSLSLVDVVRKNMLRVYAHPPKIHLEPNGVTRASWHNVELAALVRTKADELLATITYLDKELQRAFLRALFDDEGCVTYSIPRNARMVRAYQHSLPILRLAQTLLLVFGIESRIDHKGVELIISRKENLIRFRDEIGFSQGLRVNGDRTNSVWRRSLEKRAVLDRALASYCPAGTPGVHTAVKYSTL